MYAGRFRVECVKLTLYITCVSNSDRFDPNWAILQDTRPEHSKFKPDIVQESKKRLTSNTGPLLAGLSLTRVKSTRFKF